MAKTTVIYNSECNLKVNEVSYTDKVTKEDKTFKTYTLTVGDRDFDIALKPADKKLFEYILGI